LDGFTEDIPFTFDKAVEIVQRPLVADQPTRYRLSEGSLGLLRRRKLVVIGFRLNEMGFLAVRNR
jgi:hypothetical protein